MRAFVGRSGMGARVARCAANRRRVGIAVDQERTFLAVGRQTMDTTHAEPIRGAAHVIDGERQGSDCRQSIDSVEISSSPSSSKKHCKDRRANRSQQRRFSRVKSLLGHGDTGSV